MNPPYPAPAGATVTADGGWVRSRDGSLDGLPVDKEKRTAPDNCSAQHPGSRPYVCTRRVAHEGGWHVATITKDRVVAVWR